MPPRLHLDQPIGAAGTLALPASAARHAQVLRLQPGDALSLFDGRGGEWPATITSMARNAVVVELHVHEPRECEAAVAVTLALAMPANDRMDDLVEKATELGAAAILPLLSERSVLRLGGERAARRRAHWQSIAIAACEQCGRNRVTSIHPVQALDAWLASLARPAAETRLLLAWRDAMPWPQAVARITAAATLLSGPEGGLSDREENLARACGFIPTTLGPRVLRADTAPLAALAAITLATAP